MLPLEGVYAAAGTPRRLGTQDINLGVMWDLIDFLNSHQVDGIVLLGSTGEFPHYSNSERMRLMGLAAKRSKTPVVINVSHSTLDGAVELAQAAAASGAAAVLLMPPYFFRYDLEQLRGFFRRFVAEAEIDIPILLYHIPLFTNPVPIELAQALLREGLAQGIKDSSGDNDYLAALVSAKQDNSFTLLLGNDAMYCQAQGISGVVSGIASAVPELLVGMKRAIAGNDVELITRLDARLQQFTSWIDKLPVPVSIKEAAAQRGLKLGPHAIPADDRTIVEFREWFKPWLAAVQRVKHVGWRLPPPWPAYGADIQPGAAGSNLLLYNR
ncbi:MAG: dihydrodipicolinate synthase family protein [Bryobacteraceae bacterium]